MQATQHLPLQPKSDLALLYGLAQLLIAERLDRPRLHRRPHDRLRRVRRVRRSGSRPTRVAQETGPRPPSALERFAATDPSRRARLVLVDDGRQPEPPGGPHRAGDHQPGADDRQHRPARHRRQLDHRPVQRDGLAAVQQHDEPARRPRLRRRGRPRARSPACSASTSGRIPTRDRPGLPPDHRRHPPRADPRPVGRRAPTRPIPGSTRSSSTTSSAGSTSWSCRTCTTRPRRRSMADLVLPAAGWGEKEGTFINSERRIGLIKKVRRARGRRSPTSHLPARRRALGLRRDVRDVDDRPRRSSRSSSGSRPASRATSPASTTTPMLDDAGGIQWPLPRTGPSTTPRPQRRLFADGRFYHPDGRARFLFDEPRPMPEAPTSRYPLLLLTGRGSAVAVAHADPHRQVGRAAQAPPARPVRRDPPRRRRRLGARPRRLGRSSSRGGGDPGPARARTPTVTAGPGLPADARRGDEPADRRRLRPALATAGLQGLRAVRASGRPRRAKPAGPALPPSSNAPRSR